MGRAFDPITLEILWRRLISIVDEADSSVARTAFSSLLRDAHDYTCMFTDRKGRELAQGSFATPGQSGAMAIGVKKLVNSFTAYYYQQGDVFITREEIEGLMQGLLYTASPPAGATTLTDWGKANAATLGVKYASELARRKNRLAAYDRL